MRRRWAHGPPLPFPPLPFYPLIDTSEICFNIYAHPSSAPTVDYSSGMEVQPQPAYIHQTSPCTATLCCCPHRKQLLPPPPSHPSSLVLLMLLPSFPSPPPSQISLKWRRHVALRCAVVSCLSRLLLSLLLCCRFVQMLTIILTGASSCRARACDYSWRLV